MTHRFACALVLMAVVLPALAANDFNSSRSNREKGTLAVSPPAPGASSGDEAAPAVQQAQDFNTTRSNKDRRGMAGKRVLPTVNKRATAVGGPDQDCDGVACPADAPEPSGNKGGMNGHVTLVR